MTDNAGSTAAGELSPADEGDMIRRMLHHQVGINPYRTSSVLDLVAVGCVSGAWRNTIVEDWHAEGRLDDGEMLRINAHSTWRVRQIITRWQREVHLPHDFHDLAGSGFGAGEVAGLAFRIWRWLTNPKRELPTGVRLTELAGTQLDEYADEADGALGDFATMAEDRGIQFAFWRSAAHVGLACRHWWLTPTWPDIVPRFLDAFPNPEDPHWRPSPASRVALMTLFPSDGDRESLRRTLLKEPWRLESEVAGLIVTAGIGFLRHPLPPLSADAE